MYLPGRKKALLETVDKTPTMEPFLDEPVDIACNFTKEKLYCRFLFIRIFQNFRSRYAVEHV